MAMFLSNVFNDPSSPWYYVIGVVFLLLIFGALAAYIMLSKKSNKDASETTDKKGKAGNGNSTSAKPKAEAEKRTSFEDEDD